MQALTTLPSSQVLAMLVVNSVHSPHSRRAYSRCLCEFLEWAKGRPLSRETVKEYRTYLEEQGRGSSTVNQTLAAIRAFARESAQAGLIDQQVSDSIASVENIPSRGIRTGNWLTLEQAKALMALPDRTTLRGQRDVVILGLLAGAGMRRDEVARVLVSQVCLRDGHPLVVDLLRKKQRVGSIPLPQWVYDHCQEWIRRAQRKPEDPLVCSIGWDGDRGTALTGFGVWKIVHGYVKQIPGAEDIAPHDLRRTFARLAVKGGCKLDQLQVALGHASLNTTSRYVGAMMDLENSACDCIKLTP